MNVQGDVFKMLSVAGVKRAGVFRSQAIFLVWGEAIMKKQMQVLSGAVIGGMFVASAAQASTFPLIEGINNRLGGYVLFEHHVAGTGANNVIVDVGDVFRGVIQAQSVSPISGFPLTNLTSPGKALTAMYAVEVTAVVPLSATTSQVVFGPNAAWIAANGFAPGTILAAYGDTVQDFNPSLATDALVEATVKTNSGATNLIGEFGFKGSLLSDGYFMTEVIPTLIPPQEPLASLGVKFDYGLFALVGPLAGQVLPQVNPYNTGGGLLGGAIGFQYDLVGQGSQSLNVSSPLPNYNLYGSGDAQINVPSAVPEPFSATLSLMGVGAVVLSALRRR